MMVFSASGLTAVPVEMARGAKARGMRVIAVTSVAQSMSAEPEPAAGARLLEVADLVIDVCTPPADALVTIDGLDTPVGPGRPSAPSPSSMPSRSGPPSSSWSGGPCLR